MNVTVRLVEETCCNCGTAFAMEEGLNKNLLEQRRNFYCPNGHSQRYVSKTWEERVKELESKLATERAEAMRLQGEVAAERKKMARLKKRIGNGVCPSCKRHFSNVERHVKSKHPELVK